MTPIELLGWVSTIVTLSSFVFDGVRMRVVNSLGCMGWSIWGYFMGEVSVVSLNVIIILVHLFKIIREQRRKALLMEGYRKDTEEIHLDGI
jgi:uncharacterized membrane protein